MTERSLLSRVESLLPSGPVGRRDHLVGALLAIAYTTWLLATARQLGFPRDEGFYFHAGADYARWFDLLLRQPGKAMERGAIDAIWQENHEHPSLAKSLFALSWLKLHEEHRVFADASTAFRFPAMVWTSLSLWITYLFGARAYSRRAGLFGALSLGLMPHVFFHGHLACFDMPIMTMWIACIYVYWRAHQKGGLGWAIACGVVYGLTLETKHNAWILPAVFIPHALVAASGRGGAKLLRRGVLPLPASLVAMATIGPLVFVGLWPWLWNDTIPRVQEYVAFHVNHVYYNIEYLHRNYFGPPSPRSYAPVMILATVPSVTLALFLVGATERLSTLVRRWWATLAALRSGGRAPRQADPNHTDLLLFLGLSAPIAIFVIMTRTPIFGGTKHWMTAYPILALLAGRGFDRLASALGRALAALPAAGIRLAQGAFAAVALAAPLAVTAHSHPFGLSAYVPLVGGTAGGADLGLNRQFWGFTTQSLAPWLAANAPRGASVFLHDTAWDSWYRMADEKRLRPDLRAVGSPSEADIGLVHIELHMQEEDYQEWVAFETNEPAYVLTHDGVPIVTVYKRAK